MNNTDYVWIQIDHWSTTKQLPSNTDIEQLAALIAQQYIDTEFANLHDWAEIYTELYHALKLQHVPDPATTQVTVQGLARITADVRDMAKAVSSFPIEIHLMDYLTKV